MKRKFMSVVLTLALLGSTATVATTVNAATTKSTNVSASVESNAVSAASVSDKIQDGTILQCWNWSYNNIAANMPTIAAQGFTAVQTSPVQKIKQATKGSPFDDWWVMYQPVDFYIDDSSNSALGTEAEFKAMCDTAHKYGVSVIVDAVLNHMGNQTRNDLSSAIPAEYRNDSNFWHSITKNTENYNNRYDVTHNCMNGVPDLNTGYGKVQNLAAGFLKQCITDGADGFRFDGAKHIELPNDNDGASSNFWPTVLNAATSHAQSTRGITPYYYGELLDCTGGGANLTNQYTNLMSVTMNGMSWGIRDAVNQGNASSAMPSGMYYADSSQVPNKKAVLWTESHDNYADGITRGIGTKNLNQIWAVISSRASSSAMYLARPASMNQTLGTASTNTGWANEEVKAVNKFKTYFFGQAEYTSYSGSVAYCERGTSGVTIVNCNGGSTSVNLDAHKMANGTYKDQITGSTFTVSGGKISGQVGNTGVAVVYNAVAEPTATVTCSSGTTSYKTDTATLTLKYENATSGSYSLDGVNYTNYKDGDTITIGKGLDFNTSTTIYVKATDGKTTSNPVKYTFTKVDPNAVQTIYFDNSAYNWSGVYAYIYDGEGASATSNAAWPGVAMQIGASGYYELQVPENLANGRVIFTESATATTNRFPEDMDPGLSLDGASKRLSKGYIWDEYNGGGTVVQPTDPPIGGTMFGDVNGDGEVSISDATEIQLYLAKLKDFDEDTLVVADCNEDGNVDIKDVTCIQFFCVDDFDNCGSIKPGTVVPTQQPSSSSSGGDIEVPTTPPTGDITIQFKNNYNWSTVYCYYWASDSETFVQWPGTVMTKGSSIYSISVPANTKFVIFTNGTDQTVDTPITGSACFTLSGDKSGKYITANAGPLESDSQGGGSGTGSDPVPPSSDKYTMTFSNNYGWSNVYCYYWSDSDYNMTAWPGSQMSLSYTNDFGEGVYTFDIPSSATNVIFTNGSAQTVDIPITGSTKFYISGNSNGKYEVKTWS